MLNLFRVGTCVSILTLLSQKLSFKKEKRKVSFLPAEMHSRLIFVQHQQQRDGGGGGGGGEEKELSGCYFVITDV